MDQTWDSAWGAALDELELSLEESERLLGGGDPAEALAAAPWSPPQLETPLPADLLERAQSLLARQQLLVARTMTAMNGARQNLALVGKMSGKANVFSAPGRSEQAVYLDVRT